MSAKHDLRRMGIATALLTELIGLVCASSRSWVIAQTQPEWIDARSFYERAGFEQFCEDEIDIHRRLRVAGRDALELGNNHRDSIA